MSAPFVTGLRTHGAPLRLAAAGMPTITVRVQVAERWEAIAVECAPETTVHDLKVAAMTALGVGATAADEMTVKLRGHEVAQEQLTVQGAGARDGSTFLLHQRRRRPVR